jgi:hypothetical protein
MWPRNITPKTMRCGLGQCPAVFELPDGRLVIIGCDPDPCLDRFLSGKIGRGEHAVVIFPALLANFKPDNGSKAPRGGVLENGEATLIGRTRLWLSNWLFRLTDGRARSVRMFVSRSKPVNA